MMFFGKIILLIWKKGVTRLEPAPVYHNLNHGNHRLGFCRGGTAPINYRQFQKRPWESSDSESLQINRRNNGRGE